MPIALHSFKIDSDGEIRICHTFYGETEAEAEGYQKAHAKDCPHYGPALAAGKTIDITEEIDALPEANENALLELLGFDDEEEIEVDDEEE
jgi:hypothetical protein